MSNYKWSSNLKAFRYYNQKPKAEKVYIFNICKAKRLKTLTHTYAYTHTSQIRTRKLQQLVFILKPTCGHTLLQIATREYSSVWWCVCVWVRVGDTWLYLCNNKHDDVADVDDWPCMWMGVYSFVPLVGHQPCIVFERTVNLPMPQILLPLMLLQIKCILPKWKFWRKKDENRLNSTLSSFTTTTTWTLTKTKQDDDDGQPKRR